ncbi:acetylhydrolase [Streptomyces agglomeratus]|uniref:Acetylhydrolase n=1 Tax=Streptomyces agglomeratus TaxID=285458 RepID=A0A1E5P1W0_9ACTN|nr:acetylhydrolase [Streptomyces agglomeratus]OEJ23531.1 acetylhydrolase [Streptomyces agglomeratus]OEJ43125.1 acetylhydrolase [Streptomyces agglomeratus]OEJ54954.1 acetylhydrolase [Streptomyces agglomeratus]
MVTRTRTATAVALLCALALPVSTAATASASAVAPRLSAPSSPSVPAPAAPRSSVASSVPAAFVSAARAELPAPTGPYAVGSSVLHLVDRSRPDPWVREAGARELMVTLHYPAARHSGPPGPRPAPAPYATTEEARLLLRGLNLEQAVPAARLAEMRTHSRRDARPARGRHPLVLLSPGFGVSRYTLTHLAEDLAGRGYVVASVDHAYESLGTAMPGGRVLTCEACTAVEEGGVDESLVAATRADDMSFVIDRLTGCHAVTKYAAMIDKRRIGMAGHSIGGAAAATAMVADRRIGAGINMDGGFQEELPSGGLGGRPFMMLGTDDAVHRPGGSDTSWNTVWPALDGWKRWLTVAGSEHFTFSDSPVISRHFGLPQPPLPADRAVAITRTYVAAFLDVHLRGMDRPVLDGPTAAQPEVRFHRP